MNRLSSASFFLLTYNLKTLLETSFSATEFQNKVETETELGCMYTMCMSEGVYGALDVGLTGGRGGMGALVGITPAASRMMMRTMMRTTTTMSTISLTFFHQ